MIFILVCHDTFDIKSVKLNNSSANTDDDLSGVAEFMGDDFVLHAPLDVDGCIHGLLRVLRYIHFINSYPII